ncbi:hypothetical protein EWM64_g3024 [Hericium alpestre]|uniref:Tr-type G domain-containing protein n=1 Tax=Hericium alpestre TaxID=135208 RepID=A0A4Z0A1M6_9AGAM|nr:hypothetical protein EWM64_g3024 [Hericium alpestre]
MSTLRTFQSEIEQIHHREVAKQRATHAAEKESRELSKIAKERRAVASWTAHGKEKEKEKEEAAVKEKKAVEPAKGKEKDEAIQEESIKPPIENEDVELSRKLQNTADQEAARDLLAATLTQRRGEVLLRLGSHPPRARIFANESFDDDEKGWSGQRITTAELESIKSKLAKVLDDIGGKTCILFEDRGQHPRASVLLRLPPPSVELTPEVRCAVVGNVDSGKSTMLGVLTRGGLDDGRGLARVALFRHKHEIETGRTSSVGMEILGFDTAGAPILPNAGGSMDPDILRREKLGWDQISMKSAKIVTFIDLAGHERYLKTTLYGLTSSAPSCVILMVGANAGVIGMSKEHLAIALALNVPVVVCITKIDMTPPNKLAETLKQVDKIMKSPGCRKTPVFIKSIEAAIEASQVFNTERICPIFQVSNVTGAGLDFVRTFLNLLPSSEGDGEKFDASQPLEACGLAIMRNLRPSNIYVLFQYSITDVWSVPYVGTVVNGILNSGTLKAGDAVLLGPDSTGHFMPTAVKSMQRKRADVMTAEAGQTVSCALKRMKRASVRKGMVMVHKEDAPRAVRQFEGQVLILYHNTTLQKNYQAMLHCGAVRQTVRIIAIDHPQELLRTGDRATVTFEFIAHPEYIKQGMKLLFREGKTKGLGVITKLL